MRFGLTNVVNISLYYISESGSSLELLGLNVIQAGMLLGAAIIRTCARLGRHWSSLGLNVIQTGILLVAGTIHTGVGSQNVACLYVLTQLSMPVKHDVFHIIFSGL